MIQISNSSAQPSPRKDPSPGKANIAGKIQSKNKFQPRYQHLLPPMTTPPKTPPPISIIFK